jgi:hypothetical protein
MSLMVFGRLLLLRILDRLSAATPGFVQLMLQGIGGYMAEHDFKRCCCCVLVGFKQGFHAKL